MAEPRNATFITLLTKHVSWIISAIATLVPLVAFFASSAFKAWVRHHGTQIFIIWILTIVIALVIIDLLLTRQRKQASEHDRKFVAEVLDVMPPTSQTVIWMKDAFTPRSIPVQHLDKLEKLLDSMRFNILGLDEPNANRDYGQLRDSIQEFLEITSLRLFSTPGNEVVQNSPDWSWEERQAASNEISAAHVKLVLAYDEFILTCHKSGLC